MKNARVEWFGDKAVASVSKAKESGLKAGGLVVQGSATLLAPVDENVLRPSITEDVISTNEAQVGTNVEYAPYQEYGTYKMAAQPFLLPALHNNKENIRKIMAEAIGRAVK